MGVHVSSICISDRARTRLAATLHELEVVERRGQPLEMARALRDVARCHVELEMPDAAFWFLQRSLSWARLVASPCFTIEVLCELAETDLHLAAHPLEAPDRYSVLERARDHAFEAAALARESADWQCEAQALLRASQVLEQCGDEWDARRLRDEADHVMASVDPSYTVGGSRPTTSPMGGQATAFSQEAAMSGA
jgi:hypothetical protein